MDNKKLMSNVVLVLGIVLLVISLFADTIGIGAMPGFGYKQIIGAVLGVIGIIAGLVLSSRK